MGLLLQDYYCDYYSDKTNNKAIIGYGAVLQFMHASTKKAENKAGHTANYSYIAIYGDAGLQITHRQRCDRPTS